LRFILWTKTKANTNFIVFKSLTQRWILNSIYVCNQDQYNCRLYFKTNNEFFSQKFKIAQVIVYTCWSKIILNKVKNQITSWTYLLMCPILEIQVLKWISRTYKWTHPIIAQLYKNGARNYLYFMKLNGW